MDLVTHACLIERLPMIGHARTCVKRGQGPGRAAVGLYAPKPGIPRNLPLPFCICFIIFLAWTN